MTAVLDASAILAFSHNESGGNQVRRRLDGGIVLSVAWKEVAQKTLAHGIEVTGMRKDFADIKVDRLTDWRTAAHLLSLPNNFEFYWVTFCLPMRCTAQTN